MDRHASLLTEINPDHCPLLAQSRRHSHVNALPLSYQQSNRLLRNYGFLLEFSPLNKL